MLERAADRVCVERQTPAAAAPIRWRADPSARRLGSLHAQAPEAQPLSGIRQMPNLTANDPLVEANLRAADLSGANLHEADLREVNLRGASLRGAKLLETAFADVDLSEVKGLDQCQHNGPSTIDHRTLQKS